MGRSVKLALVALIVGTVFNLLMGGPTFLKMLHNDPAVLIGMIVFASLFLLPATLTVIYWGDGERVAKILGVQ